MNNVHLFNRVIRGELSAAAAANELVRRDKEAAALKAPAWLPHWLASLGILLVGAALSVVGLKPHS